jgi:sulfhydrogenase subunit beta (sulfur reductase)
MQDICITKGEWDKTIERLLLSYTIFASVENDYSLDYELIKLADIPKISYNKPKPATSLKSFFLPVKENVTIEKIKEKPRIIIGIPNCDIEGLRLLDEIYLDKEFEDSFYRNRRESSILIACDCFGIQEHCHCTSYGIKPYAGNNADLALADLNGIIVLRILSPKGEDFIKELPAEQSFVDDKLALEIERKHWETENILISSNPWLPDYQTTGELIRDSEEEIWNKFSSHCVSCGACASVCPTCSCFLLIDKPGFEKIRQMDACQYPGFERVAGGEDSLFELHHRFRHRYMCKYVWKPEKFNYYACTGCGRCIDACIGKINKNELILELAK